METLSLNAGKSEVAAFSTDSKDANKRPAIIVGGKQIKFNPTPRLLGVILDHQLSFTPHIDAFTDRLGSSFNIMNAVSHSTLGWPKDSLRRIITHLKAASSTTLGLAGNLIYASLT